MSDQEFLLFIREKVRDISREVMQEVIREYATQLPPANDASTRLRDQLALIKAKDHITVKEAALLLSCSESHIRKLVLSARKGKSRCPIPFIEIEGVTVFRLTSLLEWASPKPQLQIIKNEAA